MHDSAISGLIFFLEFPFYELLLILDSLFFFWHHLISGKYFYPLRVDFYCFGNGQKLFQVYSNE